MKYYEYGQNNSGGSFDIDDKVTIRVFIQAENASKANIKAEEIGIYFDGCDAGLDCDCCGDRWYSADEHNATDEPNPSKYDAFWVKDGVVYCRVFHVDGTKTEYRK